MITELTHGAFKVIKKVFGMDNNSRLLRTLIYTVGHIMIAMTSNTIITGADWGLAAADALIEPCINGVWYFCLDYFWTKRFKS